MEIVHFAPGLTDPVQENTVQYIVVSIARNDTRFIAVSAKDTSLSAGIICKGKQ